MTNDSTTAGGHMNVNEALRIIQGAGPQPRLQEAFAYLHRLEIAARPDTPASEPGQEGGPWRYDREMERVVRDGSDEYIWFEHQGHAWMALAILNGLEDEIARLKTASLDREWWDEVAGVYKRAPANPDRVLLEEVRETLRAWTTPVNWEDGSAEVEGRLIEGRMELVKATRALLARLDAAQTEAQHNQR